VPCAPLFLFYFGSIFRADFFFFFFHSSLNCRGAATDRYHFFFLGELSETAGRPLQDILLSFDSSRVPFLGLSSPRHGTVRSRRTHIYRLVETLTKEKNKTKKTVMSDED
jgi:hypothetical protein